MAIILKQTGSDERIVYAIADKVEPFKLTTNKYNIKNSYLSWLNYKEKLQLLIPEANEVSSFIKNKKNKSKLKDKTFYNDKILEFENLSSTEIPNQINKVQIQYKSLYDTYKITDEKDTYTDVEWNKLLNILYGDDSLEKKTQEKIKDTNDIFNKWSSTVKKFNEDYKKYNKIYSKISPYLKDAKTNSNFIYLHKLVKTLTLSNINDFLSSMDKETSSYNEYLKKRKLYC